MPDFVIVGGGVYGCAVAWHLAKQGADVCLLETETVASGASGGLGKRGVRANGRDVRELPFMKLAYDIWPTLHEQLGAPTGYERTGHLLLIEREQDFLEMEAQAWMQEKQGIASVMLDQTQLREKEPFVSEQIIAAVYCPDDGIADHTATTRAYAQAAKAMGADIREYTAVQGLEQQNGRVVAVTTAKSERIAVNHSVFLLSNAHSLAFAKQQLGVTLPIWPMYPQVMLTQPLDIMPLNHLIGHAHRTLAMKAVPGNQIMISGGWRGQRNPETGRGETKPDQVEGNRLEAAATYPGLADVTIAEAAADRPELIALDHIPIIDHLPGADNLLIATGWSGHGWAIAPAVCQFLVEWVMTGNQPDLLAPFGLGRFG
ncbi:MAG: FAD-dependent oxidoreductase [Chloroflexota bacterium]